MSDQHHSWYRYRPHPWHGIWPLGDAPPEEVDAFIELTPFDVIKYEADKLTGYLRVDRPQRTSSTPPDAIRVHPPEPGVENGSRKLSPTSNGGDKDPAGHLRAHRTAHRPDRDSPQGARHRGHQP